MATIRTSDKRKITGGQVPVASLNLKSSSEMVLVNLNHVVSVEED